MKRLSLTMGWYYDNPAHVLLNIDESEKQFQVCTSPYLTGGAPGSTLMQLLPAL
jgi:hypothetical protein